MAKKLYGTFGRKSNEIGEEIPSNLDSPCVAHRFEHYLGNPFQSDMSFLIVDEDVEIPAHKFAIGVGSTVLNRSVFGTGNLIPSQHIPVHKISSVDFMEVLRFLYTDVANLTETNVVPIYLVANYFLIAGLEVECSKFLIDVINVNNVCHVYEQIWRLEDIVTAHCVELILREANNVVGNGTLVNMDIVALGNILDNNRLNVAEAELFQVMLKWAENECVNTHIELSPANIRKMLEGRLEKVDFEQMTPADFVLCMNYAPGVFTNEEIGKIIIASGVAFAANPQSQLSYAKVKRPRNDLSGKIITKAQFDKLPKFKFLKSDIQKYVTKRGIMCEFIKIMSTVPVEVHGLKTLMGNITEFTDTRTHADLQTQYFIYKENIVNNAIHFKPPILITSSSPFFFKIQFQRNTDTEFILFKDTYRDNSSDKVVFFERPPLKASTNIRTIVYREISQD